jgi:hypothetical protein
MIPLLLSAFHSHAWLWQRQAWWRCLELIALSSEADHIPAANGNINGYSLMLVEQRCVEKAPG